MFLKKRNIFYKETYWLYLLSYYYMCCNNLKKVLVYG